MRSAPRRQQAREALLALLRGRTSRDPPLPSIRALARRLGFSKNTIIAALEALKVEGVLRSEARRGLFAERPAPAPVRRLRLDEVKRRALPDLLASGLPSAEGPRVLNVGAVAPPTSFFQTEAMVRFLSERRLSLADVAVYPDPAGLPALREALAAWVGRQGGPAATPEGLLVTAGGTQALALVLQRLATGGRRQVAVETPTSFVWVEQLRALGATLVPIARAPSALDLDALETAARKGRLAALVTTPNAQDPTGGSLTLDQRRAVVRLATRYGFVVVELETHLGLLPASSSLKALAPEQVTWVASLGRVFGPGWRLGGCLPPRPLLDELRTSATLASLGQPVLGQRVLAKLLASPAAELHVAALREKLATQARLAEAHASAFRDLGDWVDPWAHGLFRRFQPSAPLDLDQLAVAGRAANVNLHPERLFVPRALRRSRWFRVNLAQCGDDSLALTLRWLQAHAAPGPAARPAW